MRFTSKDVGCHADGLIFDYPRPDGTGDETMALAILQSHTDDGLVWEFRDRDLMLKEERHG